MRLGAAVAVPLPLVADRALAMLFGEVAAAETADPGRGQQQRIFDPRPDVAQPLAVEPLEEARLPADPAGASGGPRAAP